MCWNRPGNLGKPLKKSKALPKKNPSFYNAVTKGTNNSLYFY